MEQIQTWIGDNHKTIVYSLGSVIITVTVARKLKAKYEQIKNQRMLEHWERNSPKGVVVLHTLPRGKTIPNLSPFTMKLETYLRIAKIPYEIDFTSPWGPVGKTPWITLDGQNVTDSQVIVEYLGKKNKIALGSYTEEQRAIGHAVRIMMDEYLYWGLGLWRYKHSEGKGLNQIFNMPETTLRLFYGMVNKRVTESAWAQGIGRHSKERVFHMMKETIRTASIILGKKPFLLGDEVSEADCSFFGFIGMVKWGAPGSPYTTYLEEFPNLQEYCERMKTTFWADWDACLAN